MLYNIASWIAPCYITLLQVNQLRKKTTQFLMNVNTMGEKKQNNYTDECCDKPWRFEERIQREKVHTFATEGATTRKEGNMEIQVKMERNMFAKILLNACIRKKSGYW